MKEAVLYIVIVLTIVGCNSKSSSKDDTTLNQYEGIWILNGQTHNKIGLADSLVLEVVVMGKIFIDIYLKTFAGESMYFPWDVSHENGKPLSFAILLSNGDDFRMAITDVTKDSLVIVSSIDTFYFSKASYKVAENYRANVQAAYEESRKLLPYKIVSREDLSYTGHRKEEFRVVLEVEKLPSELEMNKIFTRILQTYGKSIDEVYVFFYMPGMNTMDVAYCSCNYTRGGEFNITVHDFALAGTKWGEK